MAGVAAALGSPAVGTLGFVFYESWTGSPGALNMVKGLAAGGVFLAISVATGLRRRAAGRAIDMGYLVASAFIGITLGDTAWLQALQLLGARKTILLNSLQPFIAWIFGVPPFPSAGRDPQQPLRLGAGWVGACRRGVPARAHDVGEGFRRAHPHRRWRRPRRTQTGGAGVCGEGG